MNFLAAATKGATVAGNVLTKVAVETAKSKEDHFPPLGSTGPKPATNPKSQPTKASAGAKLTAAEKQDITKAFFRNEPTLTLRPSKSGAIAFAGTENIEVSAQKIAQQARDAYHAMCTEYTKESHEDTELEGMPASMACLSCPSEKRVYYASSVRGSKPNAVVDLAVHEKLKDALDGKFHRTNLNCAEMQAVNDMFHANGGVVPEGTIIDVRGVQSKEDRGETDMRTTMPPCKATNESGVVKLGCEDVLKKLDIKVP